MMHLNLQLINLSIMLIGNSSLSHNFVLCSLKLDLQ